MRYLQGDRQDAVAIAVNQVARVDFETAYFHGLSKVDYVRVRMRDGDTTGEQLKARLLHGGQITDRAVDDAPHTAERQTDFRMNLTYERPDSRLMVHILQDD